MKNIVYPVKTSRLELTPYRMEHADDLYQLKQFPESHRYNYSAPKDKESISSYVKDFCAYDYSNPNGRFELAIILKESRKYIGFIGMKGSVYKPDGTAEIYYTLHRDYFRQGYGTEAVKGILEFGFKTLKLHRIWAGATCENRASWRIMEKLGMRRECLWYKDRPKPGKWIEGQGYEKTGEWENGYGYAILREEFTG